jgi:hypothetical protein
MKRRLYRILLMLPGLLGVVLGGFTFFSKGITVAATARCCSSVSDCTGNNAFCEPLASIQPCSNDRANYCVTVQN